MRGCLLFVALLLSCSRPEPPAAPTTHPSRVVTLAPNLTEIVQALGAQDRIVGTDDFSIVKGNVPKVGGVQPNVEKIVALQPQLVLATPTADAAALARSLEAAHIKLEVIPVDRLADIPNAMARIGTLLGVDAKRAMTELHGDIESQRELRSYHPRVLFVVWTSPLYVAGRETFLDDLYELTGAQNAIEVKGWPQSSLEPVLAHPPDLILYPNVSVKRQNIDDLFAPAPELRKRAFPVDENLFTHPGPRVAEAAHALNGILDAWEAAPH